LHSGESDEIWYDVWPGRDYFDRARHANTVLREALVEEVLRRTPDVPMPPALAAVDVHYFTRQKVAPMVRGLFPAVEQEVILGVLAQSVVFLTPRTITDVLRTTPWRSTAWRLANLYLLSAGAELLSDKAPRIVGLSESATCFVSMDYFQIAEPFANFVVHEVAHIFHNCKRKRIGLPSTRRREWLLEIALSKRETFAYACEAYSRLLELGDRAARQALLEEHAAGPLPPDDCVEPEEYLAILRSAISARNGWKQILSACAASRPRPAATPCSM
jgi:hypothetical protein